jgi:hypothetical protein
MRGRTLATYLVVFSSCSIATAENWTVIPHESNDKQVISIDKDSVSTNAGVTQAWFLFSFPTPRDNRYSEKQMVHFKCAQKLMLRQLIYNQGDAVGGKVNDTFVIPFERHGYRKIGLDSIDNAMLKAACTSTAKLSPTPATKLAIKQFLK